MKINVVHHIKRMKGKTLLPSQLVQEKHDKIQHPFIIKTFNKLRLEVNNFNMTKATYEKAIVTITLNGERIKALSLKSGTR
jgi:hypothetical protein